MFSRKTCLTGCALAILLLNALTTTPLAGESKGGGGLFDLGISILDSVTPPPDTTTPKPGGGGFGIDTVAEGIGALQGGLVNTFGTKLTENEKIELGALSHLAFQKEFKGKIAAPNSTKDAELIAAWRRLRLPTGYALFVIETGDIGAFTHIGGYIYMHRGLLDALRGNSSAIAFTLGHEAAHVMNGDVEKVFEVDKTAGMIVPQMKEAGIAGMLMKSFFLGYSQQQEFAADEKGMALATKAGFSRSEALKVFDHLEPKTSGKGASDQTLLGSLNKHFSTHPPISARRARLK